MADNGTGADQAGWCDEGLLHRRSRDTCPSGITSQIGQRRVRLHRRPSGWRQVDGSCHPRLRDSPTEGQYLLNNRPVAELPASERARVRNREIGFIFQSFNLIGDLTVFRRTSSCPVTIRGMKPPSASSASKRPARARRDGAPAKHSQQLSGGQQAAPHGGARRRRRTAHPARGPSRPETWTRAAAKRSWTPPRACTVPAATISMVTHDPRYARHADRSIHVFDGRVVERADGNGHH